MSSLFLIQPSSFLHMEEEHDEEDFKYCPPKKEELFSIMQSLSPILGSDFLLFDSDGLEYVASGITEPIPTGIPSFVYRLFIPLSVAISRCL